MPRLSISLAFHLDETLLQILNASHLGWIHFGAVAAFKWEDLGTPREAPGLRSLGVLDPNTAFVSGKGCQYRAASAVIIRNTTHKNSKPRIHKLSR